MHGWGWFMKSTKVNFCIIIWDFWCN
jgi:hypothetical protein